MRISFGFKIGLVFLLLAVCITTFSVFLFYSMTEDIVRFQITSRLSDIGRTGAFLFDKEKREIIKRLTKSIEKDALPITQEMKNLPKGESMEGLPSDVAATYMMSTDFQTLVQTLRQIKAGSRREVTPLRQLERLSPNPNDPYSVKYAFLLVQLPQFAPFNLLSFLVDSDYEEPSKETPIGTLYRPYYEKFPIYQRIEVSEYFAEPALQRKVETNDFDITDQWGRWIAALIPIKDADGRMIAVLGLDYDATSEVNQLRA
ncbi:MAG TPA: hypothetical protein ENG03_06755 [Thioploca sp.]|nr:MAG: hypothetical protein DRR19_07205 [Gammaproteobacteria bacterium]HDN26786.1 hypothetical protein [Thioploca sp.]